MEEKSYAPEALVALVVDNHELIRKSIGRALHKARFATILETNSANQALRLIDENRVDMVICDLKIGSEDACDLLTQLRSRELGADIPVIIVSGEADRDEIIRALSIGADDYILKPFNPEELEQKILKIHNHYQKPELPLRKIRQVEKFIKANKLNSAKTLLDEFLSENPESPRGHHLSAVIDAHDQHINKAIRKLEENMSNFPAYLKNYVTLANLYQKAGDIKSAITIMSQELWLNPKQIHRQIKLGQMLLAEGKSKQSIEHFRKALLENPENKHALFGIGRAYGKAGNLDKAIYYFKRLRRKHPDETRALKAIITLTRAYKKEKIAELILRDEKKTYPNRPDTYLLLAQMKETEGDTDSSASYLRECIKKCPTYGPSYYHLVKMHHKNQTNAAKEMFRKFYSSNPMTSILLEEARLMIDHERYTNALKTIHQIIALANKTKDEKSTKISVCHDDDDLNQLLAKATFGSRQFAKAYIFSLIKKQRAQAEKCKHEWLNRREKHDNASSKPKSNSDTNTITKQRAS